MVIVKYFIRSEELISRWYDEPSGRVKLIESGIYESDLEVSWWFLYATVDNFIIKCYNESVTFKISAIFHQNNIS